MGELKDANETWFTVTETASGSVTNAPASSERLFVDTDHLLKLRDSSGTIRVVGDKATLTYEDLTTAAAPADPTAGAIRVYSVTGDILAYRDSSGIEQQLTEFPGYAVPSVSLSTTGATGTAPTLMRSDATLAVFTATTPTTGAYGATGAAGSAGTAARSDHEHPWPAQQTAIADTSGGTLPQVEDNVNAILAALRAVGLIAT